MHVYQRCNLQCIRPIIRSTIYYNIYNIKYSRKFVTSLFIYDSKQTESIRGCLLFLRIYILYMAIFCNFDGSWPVGSIIDYKIDKWFKLLYTSRNTILWTQFINFGSAFNVCIYNQSLEEKRINDITYYYNYFLMK